KANGYLLDPHTATGVHVSENAAGTAPMVVLGTAHPAKFPDAVRAACGVTPQLPEWLSDLMQRHEKFTVLASDLDTVEKHISRLSRATV
ncbi:MAG: threonine synthase, partial [Hyphomicrobiales bacterium]|nr:threonine synthase [Hyphomicrobiales bacterium]